VTSKSSSANNSASRNATSSHSNARSSSANSNSGSNERKHSVKRKKHSDSRNKNAALDLNNPRNGRCNNPKNSKLPLGPCRISSQRKRKISVDSPFVAIHGLDRWHWPRLTNDAGSDQIANVERKEPNMGQLDTDGILTLQELMITALATADLVAKLMIDKGLITKQEFDIKLFAERANYQALLQRVREPPSVDA
jgi:hypothetical protein